MIRNYLFKRFNQWKLGFQEVNFKHLKPNQSSEMAQYYNYLESTEAMKKQYNFKQNQILLSIENPYDQQIQKVNLQILDKTIEEEKGLEQITRLQALKRLKTIVNAESKYDPEVIEMEKLRVRVIFKEPNAEAEYKTFLSTRPYLRKFQDWDENRQMKHFFA